VQTILNLGADVDSRFIMVACAENSFKPHKIANERGAIVRWLRSVPRATRLGMESTGAYHQLLADLAQRAGMQVFVINARNLRRYAQGIGQRGKTDRIDAEAIACYVAREHTRLHAYVPPCKAQRRLAQLIGRRAQAVKTQQMLSQSLGGISALAQELNAARAAVKRLITRLDALIKQTLDRLSAAREAAQHIATIPGFGVLSSTYLGYSFTRLPYSNSNAVVAQVGLDPRPADSGKKHGRRRLSKQGPSEARRLLFNCAMSACTTEHWQPYYQAQLAKGLSSTAALVVLARKMLRVAFAVYKNNSAFDPALLGGRHLT
jgi:transposase